MEYPTPQELADYLVGKEPWHGQFAPMGHYADMCGFVGQHSSQAFFHQSVIGRVWNKNVYLPSDHWLFREIRNDDGEMQQIQNILAEMNDRMFVAVDDDPWTVRYVPVNPIDDGEKFQIIIDFLRELK